MGAITFILFMGYYIDLNKDSTFQNRRQKKSKPPLSVIKPRKRRGSKPVIQEGRTNDRTQKSPRRPEKRR